MYLSVTPAQRLFGLNLQYIHVDFNNTLVQPSLPFSDTGGRRFVWDLNEGVDILPRMKILARPNLIRGSSQ